MQQAILKYAVIAHVFFLTAFLAWVHGGANGSNLTAVPWLCLGLLEVVLLLPAVRRNEALDAARRRVMLGFLRDPVFWLALTISLYLLFQTLNGGCELVYQSDTNSWQYARPPLGGGPFSIDPVEARQTLYWMMPAFAVALAIRHGITRRAKLYLLRLLVVNGAALALFGLARGIAGSLHLFGLKGAPGFPFAAFESAAPAGIFFTLLFVVNGGLFLQAALDVDDRKHTRWLLAALTLNFVGAMFSLGRASILTAWIMALAGGIFSLVYAWPRMNLAERLRTTILGVASIALATAFLFFVFPRNRVREELLSIEWDRFFGQVFGDQWLQTLTALRIWEDYPWFGVGGMGYRHFAGMYIGAEQWSLLPHGAEHARNDCIQFLCEHGAVGFGLMLAAVLIMLVPVFQRLLFAYHGGRDRWDGDRLFLLRVSPVTLSLLAAVALAFLHGLIDVPFRSPAILITCSIALACAPAFLPVRADIVPDARRAEGRTNKPKK